MCGNTQVPAPELHSAIEVLSKCDPKSGKTGFEKQFQVSSPTHTHTYTHARTHTHMHARTHTHTRMLNGHVSCVCVHLLIHNNACTMCCHGVAMVLSWYCHGIVTTTDRE